MAAPLIRYLFYLCYLCPILAFGQNGLTLSDAIRIGLKNNYDIQISEIEEKIAKNNNTMGAAGAYPSIQLSLGTNNVLNSTTNPVSVNSGTSYGTIWNLPAVDVGWTLFEGYKVNITKSQLEKLEEQSDGNTKELVERTITTIVKAYYNAVVEQEQLRVLRESQKISQKQWSFEAIKKSMGNSSTFDVLQSEAAYLSDSTNVLLQVEKYERAMLDLGLAMGEKRNRKFRLADKLRYRSEEYNYSVLKERMLRNNQGLKNRRITAQLNNYSLELAKTERMPKLRLNTGLSNTAAWYNQKRFDFETLDVLRRTDGSNTFAYFVGLSLTWNAFDGGRVKRQIANASLRKESAELAIEQEELRLTKQLNDLLNTLERQRQVVRLTERLIGNVRANLSLGEEKWRAGLISSFDFRSMQKDYIQSNQSRMTAIYNLKLTELELMRLIGSITTNKF